MNYDSNNPNFSSYRDSPRSSTPQIYQSSRSTQSRHMIDPNLQISNNNNQNRSGFRQLPSSEHSATRTGSFAGDLRQRNRLESFYASNNYLAPQIGRDDLRIASQINQATPMRSTGKAYNCDNSNERNTNNSTANPTLGMTINRVSRNTSSAGCSRSSAGLSVQERPKFGFQDYIDHPQPGTHQLQPSFASSASNNNTSGVPNQPQINRSDLTAAHNYPANEIRSTPGVVRNHICPTCGKGFGRPSSLAQHELIHTGERPFACMTCGKAFNTTSNLKRHQTLHDK